MRDRLWFPALFVLVLSVCFAAPLDAKTIEGEHGTYYLPDELDQDTVTPVLICEKGLAAKWGKLWELLSKNMSVVVVECLPTKSAEMSPDIVDKALVELGKHFRALEVSPWVPIAFSEGSAGVLELVKRAPKRFQGLLVVNAQITAADLPKNLADFRHMAVGIIHGKQDSRFPVANGEGLRDRLVGAGFRVLVDFPDTKTHLAPFTTPRGAAFVQGYLQRTIGPSAVAGRPLEARTGVHATVRSKAPDGLDLTADLYEAGDRAKPVLLLFHQAGSSRGEYRKIAPRLVQAGYNCLALDARSGRQWEGVDNETASAAQAEGKETGYLDARQDLERAIGWVRELGFKGPLGIVGSSYSAALALGVGADRPEVDVVVAFSAGDYLQPRGTVFEYARKLKKPTLLIAPPNEATHAQAILDATAAEQKSRYVHEGGMHGARTLYLPPATDAVWKQLMDFLGRHIPSR